MAEHVIKDGSGNIVGNLVGDLNGVTYTVSSSTPSSPTTDDVWYDTVNKVNKVYNGSTWDAYGGDPTLTSRVTALENTNVSGLRTFAEDFKTQNLVNLGATDATVGVGYVRTDKLALFTEDYSTTNNLDAPNSTNVAIDTVGKKLSITSGNTSGLALSKVIPTLGTTHATLNAVVNHKSVMAFSSYTKHSSANLTVDHSAPCSIMDRSNRTWHVWQVLGSAGAGGLYAKVVNSDGTTAYTGFIYTGNFFVQNAAYIPFTRMVVDYNNRIWIIFSYQSAASTFSGFYMALNTDFTVFKAATSLYANVTAGFVGFGDAYVDRNNRIWFAYGTNQSASTFWYAILNADGTAFVAQTPQAVTAAAVINNTRLIYDSVRDRIVIARLSNHASRPINLVAYSLTGASVVAESAILFTLGATLYALSAMYTSTDNILVFTQNVTNKNIVMYTINSATLALVSTVTISATSATVDTPMSPVLVRGSDYLIAYATLVDSATIPTIHVIGVLENGTVSVPDMNVNIGDITGDHRWSSLYVDSGDNIKVTYSSKKYSAFYTVEEAKYVNTFSTVAFSLSNDNGTTWLPATLGTPVTFPVEHSQMRVKANLAAPQLGFSPDIISYSLVESNDTTNPGITRTFYSSTLPSALPVAKAMVTATMDLSGGSTIAWFLSNDGGANWNAVTLGQLFTFSNALGGDLRVKAVLTYPITATKPPIITAYTVSSFNLVSIGDITSLQINLIKTNFKVSVLQNAAKYALRNMVIDDYNSTSGVNTGLTTATYDSTNKLYNAGVIVSNADTTTFAPVKVLLSAEYTVGTGSVYFEISRNGGTNWTTVIPDQLIDISAQPTGTSLVSRTTLTGNATITSIGYSWG